MYKPTRFTEEKKALYLKDNKAYTDHPPEITKALATNRHHRLGKDRIGKETYGELNNVGLTKEQYAALCERYGRGHYRSMMRVSLVIASGIATKTTIRIHG